MELRYSELKYDGQVHTEQWKIDEILIKNKFNWMVNAEIKNARLEIFQDTLVWNAGIWYNGDWFFGVWRDGEWRYGTWQNGVWYNGVWRNGTFKSGIIYNGKFFKGQIESGEIRGGQFIDIEIDPKVIEYTGDEYQAKKDQEQKADEVTATPEPQTQPNKVRVQSASPASQQQITQPKPTPKIQKEFYRMKNYQSFILVNESMHYDKEYYIGKIAKNKKVISWSVDGEFKGFNNEDKADEYMDKLKDEGFKHVKKFTKKEMKKLYKTVIEKKKKN